MIVADTYAGTQVAVFGMARSGLATARALIAGGATVLCWDDGERGRATAAAVGLPLVDLGTLDWSRLAALVLTPGVPLTHPTPHWTVLKAHGAGVPVIGDTELYFQAWTNLPPATRPKVIGITGTNGKSTTTALIAHLLRASGRRTAMGGNIGEAVMGLAPFSETDAYVLELSSYQIDLTPTLQPDVGILLNLTPDHLDRHGDMAGYAAVKERLVKGAALAAVGVDDPWCRDIALRRLHSGRTTIGMHVTADATRDVGQVTAGDLELIIIAGGQLLYAEPELALRDRDTSELAGLAGIATLKGSHNAQNAAAAFAACQAIGIDAADIAKHLRSYPGLAHRMELVGHQGGTLFVNDSKATNADAAAKALSSYVNIHWIAGGRPKEGGIEPLAPFFDRIAKAYLIGEATETFAATLAGRVPFERCSTMESAVMAAAADTHFGTDAVVLLSPACASFDQFADFEKRGDAFRALVQALPDWRAN